MTKDAHIAALQAQVNQLTVLLDAALVKIAELEQRLNMNSRNSDKPPSSDGLSKKPALPRKRGLRKSGGQPGHPGRTLNMSERPDHRIIHPMTGPRCTCGCDLTTVSAHLDWERRQVFDLPPTLLEVTEHRREHKTCPDCQRLHLAPFPRDVNAPVQYGERVRSLAVLLNVEQSLPLARVQELFAGLTGYGISAATVQAAVARTYDKLEIEEAIIHQAVLKSSVAHGDETGARIAGKLHWVHGFSSLLYTLYVVYRQRGGAVINGPESHLADYTGRLVHDCLNSYLTMAGGVKHSLCNAHLLRELTALMELPPAAALPTSWPAGMHALLMDYYRASDHGKGVVSSKELAELDRRYRELLALADREEPPPKQGKRGRPKKSKGRNLRDRLENWQEAVLAFSRHPAVPFTNNLGERDLRPWKTKLKVAGCFRTLQGAQYYARIKGFCSTAKKHGRVVFDELVNVQRKMSFLRLT
ncbi:IS66 family transposase [Neolewinella sp.]|uniref:IS66 family transposase n=1 Tax=Neolewinella sp. TaxID=2993543 RepID=UPI003B52C420